MREGWQVATIWGISLRIHPSWFVIVALATVMFQLQITRMAAESLPAWIVWVLGLVTALLLFLSVLLHELGHSLVALHEGVKVRSITLCLLGGIAQTEKDCPTAMASLRVAAAGPLVSLVLGGLLLGFFPAASSIQPLLGNLFGQLGALNLILALFNLLPGLPLDGGLIIKALVWQVTGSQRQGIQVANNAGRILSLTAVFIGIWLFLRGGGLSSIWIIMLGCFGLGATRNQSQILALQQALQDLRVADAAERRFRVLEHDQPLRRLSQIRLSNTADQRLASWVLICRSGRWIGYVSDQPLRDLPVQQWDHQILADHVRPLEELACINDHAPLWQAVRALEHVSDGRLLVKNAAGIPCGTLDRCDLGEAVLRKLGVKLPETFLATSRRQNAYPFGLALSQVVESMADADLTEGSAESLSIHSSRRL